MLFENAGDAQKSTLDDSGDRAAAFCPGPSHHRSSGDHSDWHPEEIRGRIAKWRQANSTRNVIQVVIFDFDTQKACYRLDSGRG
jgi:hypothetical protein